jgi:hypothetical protein
MRSIAVAHTMPDSPVDLPLIALVVLLLFAAKQCELRRSRAAAPANLARLFLEAVIFLSSIFAFLRHA